MFKYLLALACLLPASTHAETVPVPRPHPALQEFDTSRLDALRQRVQDVINAPADLAPDKVAAFVKTRRAAEAGDAQAMLELAQMLHQGEGTQRDTDAGLAWLKKAAEGGNGPAQAFLGAAYVHGQGMAVDRKLGETD